MKIKNVKIIKFRGFKDIEFEVGENLTAIAGQNGTQKTTLLGIISQPFTITEKDNPIIKEKPLTGGNFKSDFSEKFKLSEENDEAGSHEWTLYLDNGEEFPLTSMYRDTKNKKDLRFWRKGTKAKGSGYIQLPVIFLSLKRLIPIGEDKNLNVSYISLTKEEIKFLIKYHKKILLIQDDISTPKYLSSKLKNTIGVNTSYYDWKQNSCGQDNVGKILLAILSFKRLKEKYPEYYEGGILAIDELEATLYPAAQEKLVEFLSEFSGILDLQIFFTTHSLEILKKIESINSSKNRIIFFEKINNNFYPKTDYSYKDFEQILKVFSLTGQQLQKLTVYCEDEEGRTFAKQLLGRKITKHLNFEALNFGASQYIDFVKRKVKFISFPNCLILLDGDSKEKIPKKFKHILTLPGDKSPERVLADFFNNLSDDDEFWKSIGERYYKQVCFRNYAYEEIMEDRDKAKKWFNEQKKNYWGRNASKALNYWISKNKNQVKIFKKNFIEQYNRIANIIGREKL